MNKLICELCGSNEVVKDNDYWVCQHCGSKYTTEEARKIILSGSVKIDNTDKIDNLYKLARRAKETNNSADGVTYYSEILRERPNDWEAAFFSIYFRACNCTIANITNEANNIDNSIYSIINLIKNNLPSNEYRNAYSEINHYLQNLVVIFGNNAFSSANDTEKENRLIASVCMYNTFIESICSVFNDNEYADLMYDFLIDTCKKWHLYNVIKKLNLYGKRTAVSKQKVIAKVDEKFGEYSYTEKGREIRELRIKQGELEERKNRLRKNSSSNNGASKLVGLVLLIGGILLAIYGIYGIIEFQCLDLVFVFGVLLGSFLALGGFALCTESLRIEKECKKINDEIFNLQTRIDELKK